MPIDHDTVSYIQAVEYRYIMLMTLWGIQEICILTSMVSTGREFRLDSMHLNFFRVFTD